MTNQDCLICKNQVTKWSGLVVYEDPLWLVRHSNETNILGYFIIEPKRHFLDLAEATAAESAAYGSLLAKVMKGIHSIVDCQRIYTFSLAEAVPHFHVHVIPRTESLPRNYRGRGIMSYPTQPSAAQALIEQTCERMSLALRRLF
ncbi:MAG: HIT domain-containing protein [Candidatus Obscuribacterales bacterium]|jgi:diadenosine tetraphosphate (Ap4A) HIT family hydrolase|nr:HIT domain-containing protein [Candidatus Obscuribacterales bacterium]